MPQHRILETLSRPASVKAVVELIESGVCPSGKSLTAKVCETFGFLSPNGALQTATCNRALQVLEKRGLIEVPKQKVVNQGEIMPRLLGQPIDPPAGVPSEAGDIDGLHIQLVRTTEDRKIYAQMLYDEHPQGAVQHVGRQLRYLIRSAHGELGGLGFAAAALWLADRERWIGWDDAQRRSHLHRVVALSRFLVRPAVRCRNLASKVLAICLRRMPVDFRQRYGFAPYLVETFVDSSVHSGTCYRASGWKCVGQTTGRGRFAPTGAPAGPRKFIFVRALEPDFRSRLGISETPRHSFPFPKEVRRPAAPRASHESLDLSPRSFHTAFGGLFLFLSHLLELDFPSLVSDSSLPGSPRIPALCHCLALLSLKLWSDPRPANALAGGLDSGIGLFCGLNRFPERSALSEYSCRVDSRQLRSLAARVRSVADPVRDVPNRSSFHVDIRYIPYHGHRPRTGKPHSTLQGSSEKGAFALFARDCERGQLCYLDIEVRKRDPVRHEAVLRFVEDFWARTGWLPSELIFDLSITTYQVLSQLDAMDVGFITYRRFDSRQTDEARLSKLAGTLFDSTSQREAAQSRHPVGRNIIPRISDGKVRLNQVYRGLRQIAITDEGHAEPIQLLTNHFYERDPGVIAERFFRCAVFENAIADAVDFFHGDALASSVSLKIGLDLQFTLIADTLYRKLARQIGKGHEKAGARQIFERFVNTPATIRIADDAIEVRLAHGAHSPLLKAAGCEQGQHTVPWLGNRKLRLVIAEEAAP